MLRRQVPRISNDFCTARFVVTRLHLSDEKRMSPQGCHIVVYPGAFNLTTGPLHWELLQRAR